MGKPTDFYLDPILEPEDALTLTQGLARTIDLNFTQTFVIHDIGVSSRIMNNWVKLGILPNKLRIEFSTYRFNFVELIWFNIVKELREFGFSLPKIRKVKTMLIDSIDYSDYYRNLSPNEKDMLLKKLNGLRIRDKSSKQQFLDAIKKDLDDSVKIKEPIYTNILNILINEFLLFREETILMIDVNGNVMPVIESEKDDPQYDKLMDEMNFDRESFMTISLFKFFRKFVSNRDYFNFVRENRILNENEAHILSLLREGKAKAITIRFKDEKPFMLEVTREKKILSEARLSEILLRGGYQDISMKTENGNIIFSNIVTKEKLK